MGDAAGELADRLRPPGPEQPLLELPALGHVGGAPDEAEQRPIGTEARNAGVEQPAVLPVVPQHAVLEMKRPPARQRVAVLVEDGGAVLRMHPVQPPVAELRLDRPAGELEPARVDVVAGAVRGGGPDQRRKGAVAQPGVGVRGRAGGGLEPAVELGGGEGGEVVQIGQLRLAPAMGCVIDDAEGAEHLSVRREQRHAGVGHQAHVADRRVVAQQRVLARVDNHEIGARGHRVLAERIAERRPASGRRGLREPGGTRQELAVLLHQAEKRRRAVQQPAGEPGETLDGRVRRRVQEAGAAHGSDSFRVPERGGRIPVEVQGRDSGGLRDAGLGCPNFADHP